MARKKLEQLTIETKEHWEAMKAALQGQRDATIDYPKTNTVTSSTI